MLRLRIQCILSWTYIIHERVLSLSKQKEQSEEEDLQEL